MASELQDALVRQRYLGRLLSRAGELQRVKLGLLEPADLRAAVARSAAEGWNQTATDWSRLIELEPAGCFAARRGKHLVGTVTTITYGRALAWIGMMVVRPEFRRQGLGAALMRRALDYLHSEGIRRVGLDATPAGRPLYESFGFTSEAVLERWQGIAPGDSQRSVRDVPNGSLQTMRALDQFAYAADRSRLLESMVADGVGDPLVVEPEYIACRCEDAKRPRNPQRPNREPRPCGGYALVRCGRIAAYIGPLIATTAGIAEELLDEMLARFVGEEICLDLHLGGVLQPSVLAGRGLSKRRTLTRMVLGARDATPTSPLICASAGPELG